ncbi:MAG: peptidylprolyl isomerase [Nitrospinaceae bacterium]
MTFLKKFIDARAVIPLLVAAMLYGAPVWAMILDRVVAKVDDEIITWSALVERMNAEMLRFAQLQRTDLPPKDKMMMELLDRMIDEKLQIQDGKNLGISVDDESVMKMIEDVKKSNNLSEGQLEEMLARESTTIERYKQVIRDRIMVSKVMGFQVKNRTKVSDREIKVYYQRHRKEYWTPPKIQARHILFILDDKVTAEQRRFKEAKAREVLKRVRAGESFESLAREFSEDVSASSGGDLGVVERGKMVPEFEKAVFSLKAGEVSGLVKTPYGLHIVKADRLVPGQAKPLADVKRQIEQTLMMKKFDKAYESYMADLRKTAFIEKKLFDEKKTRKRIRSPRRNQISGVSRQARGGARKKMLQRRRQPGSQKARGASGGSAMQPQKSRPKRKIHPDEILPPLTIKPPGKRSHKQHEVASRQVERAPAPKAAGKPRVSRIDSIQQELKKIKRLRDENEISETEYLKKKRELLKNL